jgi:ketosteroid isomerase-like protein
MAAVDDVNELIEQYDLALGEFVKGNPEPVKELFSRPEDVTLANPLFPVGHGWEQVAERLERAERAASTLRDGEITGFETVEKHVTPELAYVVRVERQEGKVGGGENVASFALRVTMIFRPEDGIWKAVHRHADPIITPRPAESLIQQ